MTKNRVAIARVLMGHQMDAPNVDVGIEDDGRSCRIWGHSTALMPVGVQTVVLLSDDSTSQKWKLAADAESAFMEAAVRLVRENVEFYTVLRPTWALRALRWTREYR